MPSTTTTPVAARVPNEHAAKIAALARRTGATTSVIVGRIIAERFDPSTEQIPRVDDDA